MFQEAMRNITIPGLKRVTKCKFHAGEPQILRLQYKIYLPRNYVTLVSGMSDTMLWVNYSTKTCIPLEEKIRIRRIGNVLGKQDLCNNTHNLEK